MRSCLKCGNTFEGEVCPKCGIVYEKVKAALQGKQRNIIDKCSVLRNEILKLNSRCFELIEGDDFSTEKISIIKTIEKNIISADEKLSFLLEETDKIEINRLATTKLTQLEKNLENVIEQLAALEAEIDEISASNAWKAQNTFAKNIVDPKLKLLGGGSKNRIAIIGVAIIILSFSSYFFYKQYYQRIRYSKQVGDCHQAVHERAKHQAEVVSTNIIYADDTTAICGKAKLQNGFGAWTNYTYFCPIGKDGELPMLVPVILEEGWDKAEAFSVLSK